MSSLTIQEIAQAGLSVFDQLMMESLRDEPEKQADGQHGPALEHNPGKTWILDTETDGLEIWTCVKHDGQSIPWTRSLALHATVSSSSSSSHSPAAMSSRSPLWIKGEEPTLLDNRTRIGSGQVNDPHGHANGPVLPSSMNGRRVVSRTAAKIEKRRSKFNVRKQVPRCPHFIMSKRYMRSRRVTTFYALGSKGDLVRHCA
jgi:hypothetical protein